MSTMESTSTLLLDSKLPAMSGLMPPVYYDNPPQALYFTPDGLPPKPLTPEKTFEKERRHERETLRVLFSRYSLPLPEFIEKEGINKASPSWDLGRTAQMVTYDRALRDSKITGVTSLLTSPYNCVEDIESSSEGPVYGTALPPCPSANPKSLKRSLEESASNDGFISPQHSLLVPKFSKLSPPPLSPAYKKQKPTVTYPPDAVPTKLSTDRPTFSSNFENGIKSTRPTTSSPTAAEIGRGLRKGLSNQTMRKRKMKEALLNRRSANAAAQCGHPEDQTQLSTAEVSAIESQAEESDHLTKEEEVENHETEDNAVAAAHTLPPSTPNQNEYFRAPYNHAVGFPPERPAAAKQTRVHASMPRPYRGHSSAYVNLQEEDSQDNTIFEPEVNMDEEKHEFEEFVDSSENIESPMTSEEEEAEQIFEKSKNQNEVDTGIQDLDYEAEECRLDDEATTATVAASGSCVERFPDWEVVEINTSSLAVVTSAKQYEVEFLDEDKSQPGPTAEETPAPGNWATYPDADESQESTATECPSRKKFGAKDHKIEKLGKGVQSSRIQKSSSRTHKNMKGPWSMNAVRLKRACSV